MKRRLFQIAKAHIAEKNMIVEEEEVLPDKTIVMTLRVQ
jgi:hypothetical protein